MGHVAPEAQVGGPIALVQDGDIITIDGDKLEISVDVSPEELSKRSQAYKTLFHLCLGWYQLGVFHCCVFAAMVCSASQVYARDHVQVH